MSKALEKAMRVAVAEAAAAGGLSGVPVDTTGCPLAAHRSRAFIAAAFARAATEVAAEAQAELAAAAAVGQRAAAGQRAAEEVAAGSGQAAGAAPGPKPPAHAPPPGIRRTWDRSRSPPQFQWNRAGLAHQ